MRFLFDTNVFRDIQRRRIKEIDVARIEEKLKAGGHIGCISPLTLIELGGHIRDEERSDFVMFRDAFRAVTRLCQQAVHDPETFMRLEVFLHPVDGMGLDPAETLQICQAIASADTFEGLIGGQIIPWMGVLAKVSFQAGYLDKFRTEYEAQYMADMLEHVVSTVVPDHLERRAAGKIPYIDDPSLRAKVLSFIDSDVYQSVFYRLQAARVGVALIGEQSAWDVSAMAKLDAFGRAYRWILRRIVESGYNPAKNKNDFNDLHLLIYLAANDLHLITDDRGIARKVGVASPQSARILTIQEWLNMP